MTNFATSSFQPLPSSLRIDWDNHLLACQGHLLQTWAWGELKSRFGWTAQRLRRGETAAQILFRQLPLGFTIAYIPKGPLVDWSDVGQCQAFFSAIHAEAKKRRAILLKIEPDIWRAADQPPSPWASAATDFLTSAGFTPADTIQPRTSILVDLSGAETEILAAMKQKTRYNIRLAEKKGVTVRQGNITDVPTFYHLAQLTAARDGFGIHSLSYYQLAYQLFAPAQCTLLLAEFEGQLLAALMAFKQGQQAYYFYGASSNEQRHLMATYLLQWEAMRWAKSQGCTRYDLWGIPNADLAALEAEFEQRHEGLWGVYRFKRGFGGQWVQSLGAFDYVYNSLFYTIYRWQRQTE
jgi:lipid II:glycine glycyltransferase (peptidoglycan interpeptide bridge formation enzyme)